MSVSQRATKWGFLAVAAVVIGFEASPRASLPPVPSNTWAQTSALNKARSGAASVLLQDGRILITGGESSGTALTSSEIYDGTDGTFRRAASMKRARYGHAAAALRDGRVLVVGGDAKGPAQTAEIYDPASNSWSMAGHLVDSRVGATATLLDDGRVLIAGGLDDKGNVLASLEIFDPATTTFTYAGSIVPGRTEHSASLLRDGRVLIVGGSDGHEALNSAEIFDPQSLSTSPAPALSGARAGHTATTLLDGTVLIVGGHDDAADLASAELYDPKTGLFLPIESTLTTARSDHAAFQLPHNAGVLIVGGQSGGAALDSAELYMPWTKTFHSAASMSESRVAAAGGALGRDGLLVIAGGRNASGSLASAELYGFATVKTDKGDYAPGENVRITGSGWKPGEQVTLVLHEDLTTPLHDDDVLTATADAAGNILNKQFAPDDHDLGLTFYLTATGTESEAQTTFTDAPINGPAFNIVKNASVPGGTADVAGELVTYFITVANIGNQSLTGVTVTDPFVSDLMRIGDVVGNNDGTLDVGETWAYTASHTVTQTDLDTNGGGDGLINNTATVTSDQTAADHDDASVLVRRTPGLTLVKSATESSFSTAGQTLHYSYLVTNTGNVTLAGPVTVTDDKTTVTCPAGSLAPAASLTCTATYVVTQADLNAGSVTNQATAHANGTDSPQASKTVNASQSQALSLVKSATETTYTSVGQTLHYSYLVTNSGNVTLAGPVTVADDKATVSCPAGGLAPLASLTCNATYTITQADLNAGSVTNHATAHANGTDSSQASKTVTATLSPALSLVKSATETTYSAAGQTLHYSYLVTNTGNVALAGPVTVTDDKTAVACPNVNTVGNFDANLDPTEAVTCTATYTVTQADLNAGSVTNHATAHANGTNSSQATKTVNATQSPALSLVKSATETTYSAAGQALHYSYLVTNTGNVSLAGPVTVTDDLAAVTCPNVNTVGNFDANLDPVEAITCSATYSITQADVNAGSVTNHATAHANGTNSSQATKTVNATQSPALSLVKSATETTYTAVGQTLHYSYLVTNSGNVSLAGPVTVTDDKATVTCPNVNTVGNFDANLDPTEAVTCTATYTVTQADLNAGSVTNHATAHANGTNSSQATKTVNATQSPALSLVKSATETIFSAVGQTLHYSYLVTNAGNVALAGPVTVTDDKATVTCPNVNTVGNFDANLDPTEAVTCTATYTVTQADLNAGSVTNHATAHANGTDSSQATKTVNATQSPALTLVKSATETTFSGVGQTLHYSYLVTNTGNVSLAGPVTVTDDRATVACPNVNTIGNADGNLDPVEAITCSATYTITQADLNAGLVTNHATAHVNGTNSSQATKTVNATQSPALTVVKSATETTYSVVGQPLHYSYLVTNTGNVSLAGPVTVTDDKATVTCPNLNTVGNFDANLDPAEAVTCTATYTVTQGDLNSGSVTNHATGHAAGTDSSQAAKTVNATQTPALSLVKSATETTYSAVGQTLHYSYLVTNAGNVSLAGPVTVTDDKATVTCPNVNTVGNFDTKLDPTEAVTCSATYTVTQADLNAGSVTNHATAHAAGTDSPQAAKTVSATQSPALSLAKSATETTYSAVGQLLHYSYLVTNTGNISLAGPVTVTDDKATVTCPNVNTVGNFDASLDPTEVVTCSATYAVTQADLNAGSVTNHATTHANGTNSPQAMKTVNATQSPALSLVKSATETTYTAAGQTLHYSYLVTNTGNVSLAGPVTVTDDKATVTCPNVNTVGNFDANLDPAEAVTCTATYTVTQPDVNAGSVTNHATAHANGTNSSQASKTVSATQSPAISLAKSATETSFNTPGQTLHYSYLVTNTGNVSLAGPVTVADDKATVTCPNVNTVGNSDANLDPAEGVTCSATYTVTQADLDSGGVTNHATAHASGTDSTQAMKTVPAAQHPAMSVAKSASVPGGTADMVGEVVSYTITVQNVGNVTLTGIVVTDGFVSNLTRGADAVGNNDARLDVGETWAYTASHTVTQSDLDTNGGGDGLIDNTATVTSHEGASDSDDASVPVSRTPALSLVKSAMETTYTVAGQALHYSYLITNTGNVTFTGPVTVTDDKATVSCPSGALAPSASLTCTATYTITQADLNAGAVTNHATGHANGTDSPQASKTVTATQTRSLSLVKSALESTYTAAGQTLHYSYLVTNTGNVSLAGPVTVTDDKATVTCPNVNTIGNVDANLDPTEAATCSATYVVTQADLNAGSVTNHATAHAAGTDSPQAMKTVNATQSPALSLVKSATETTYTAAGQTLHYSYLVTNSGNLSLAGPVTVTDDKAAVTCPNVNTVGNFDANLDPTEAMTCSATYTVAQADLNAGSVTNHATAHANGTNSSQATKTVNATQSPALSLMKSATETTYSAAGQTLHYSYLVTNSGNVSLAGPVTVTDDKATTSCPNVNTVGNLDANLDPAEAVTCTATYTVTQADLNGGSVTNHATAHANGTNSSQATKTVNATQTRTLSLVKSATETSFSSPGQTLHYSYLVTNSGNVSLAGPVTVTDDKATVTCPNVNTVGNFDANLDPAEVVTCAATFTVTQADVDGGGVTNHATAHAAGTDSPQVAKTVPAAQHPSLTMAKSASVPGGTADVAGEVITYTITIQNTGNLTLTGIAVSDPFVSGLMRGTDAVGNNDAKLDVGETWVYTATHIVTQADLDTNGGGDGLIDNTATVTSNEGASDSDDASVQVIRTPGLSLVKSATETTYTAAGQTLHYSYLVTNSGNVTLAGPVTVTDDKATVSCSAGALAPLASLTCTASYLVTQGDLNAGSVTNHATAHANGTDSPQASKTVTATQSRSLSVVKSATETTYTAAGQALHYSYLVTNTGNVSLAGPVTVTDDKATVTCPSVNTVGNFDANLDPTEAITCAATYTVTQGDLNAGSVTNHATAHAAGTDSPQATKTINATQTRSLSLVKSATETTYSAAGQTLHYGYLVTNTGNVSLAGPVTVTDDKATVSCPNVNTVGNFDGNLDPAEAVTCSATYTVTQLDLNVGSVTNHATAHAAGTDSPQAMKTVNAIQSPALSLVKSATETTYTSAGQALHYSYQVTNTGNVSFAGPVTVTDDKATVTCPNVNTVGNFDANLDPTEMITCAATYTITQGDLNTGSVTNHATAHASGTDSPQASKTVNATQSRALSLVKSATETTYTAAGQTLHYGYLVTNTGNVSLAGPVTVTDDKATVTCPNLNTVGNFDANLDPTEAITCAATYTVAQADLNAGSVTNHATAHANGTDSAQASKTVTATQTRTLSLVKSAPETTFTAAGQMLHYSYLVTNTGNVSLAGAVTVTDDKATVTCPNVNTVGNFDGNLDPIEAVTCSATYTVTQADLNAGSVTNHATAHANGTDSTQASKTINATQSPALSLVKSAMETTFTTAGQTLHYSYLVTNAGNVSLAGPVTVTDDKAAVTCPNVNTVGNFDANLDPTEAITCAATYTITQGDLNAGSVTNHATAHAAGTDSPQATKTLNAAQTRSLSLVKSATETTYTAAGQTLHYSYLVTNTGNVSLVGPVTVTDDKATVTCPNVNTVGNFDTNLDPTEAVTCTATYLVTQADLNAGSVTNHATAHANGTDSTQASKTVTATQSRSLSLVKSATETTYGTVGELLHYSYLVTNSGNVSLAGPVTVTDDKAAVTCPNVNTVGNSDANLDPTEAVTCTATYTITQADLNAGNVTNHANAHAAGTDSSQATKTVPASQHPELSVAKSASVPGGTANVAGEAVSYTITVQNVGNVTLTSIVVSDPFISNLMRGPDAVGNNDAALDVGETWAYTASHTVTQADLDSNGGGDGLIDNTVTVTSHEGASDSDDASVPVVRTPALSLVKSVTETSYSAAGQTLHYSYLVTNTGNVSLAGPVTVTDDKATVTCPAVTTVGNFDADLNPTEAVTCTANYTTVQADVDGGSVTNHATAHGGGTDSNNAMATVPVDLSHVPGSIKIQKYSLGGDGTFSFTTSNFAVGPITTSAGTGSQTVGGLMPGTGYTIAEVGQAGWDAGAFSCDHGTAAAIQVLPNQMTTCTITNTKRGAISIQKVSIGGDAMFSFTTTALSPASFNITTSGGTGPAQVFGNLVPGSGYAVSETVPMGWSLTSATCSDGSAVGNIMVDPGELVTCTFTNTKTAPTGNLVLAMNFDEGTGSTAHDHSGFGNDGTIYSTTWTASGKNGKGLSFDGINDWVTVADAASLDLSTEMTLEAWVKPSSNTGWRAVLHKEGIGPEVGLSYAMYDSDYSNGPSGYATTSAGADEWVHAIGPSQLPLNTWTHIAVTYDGASLKVYVNAVLVRTVARTGLIIPTSGPLRIGGSSVVPNPVGPQYFKGLMDDVRIYNRALSQSEIATDRLTPVP